MNPHEKIDRSIQEFVNQEWDDGTFVAHWIVVLGTAGGEDGSGGGFIASQEDMPAYIRKGLLREALDAEASPMISFDVGLDSDEDDE